jgi:hypothetical protein
MVALEAKPMTRLPWQEIDPSGPILVLVVPQVNAEIDKRKRDGRLGKRAREFNRLISPAAESASAARIYQGPPVVDIAIATCDRVDWDSLNDLDPESPDARVVAQILHVRGVPPDRRLLFTHDINPIAMASRHGLKTRKLPDDWLLEPEPSPNERELTRARARVRELEATAPDLETDITFGVGAPLQLFQVDPLSQERQSELVERILAENPKPPQRNPFDLDYTLDRRYEKYRTLIVPQHASTLHRRLEAHYGQVPFLLWVTNVGHIQAENLVLLLTAIGGTLHKRFVSYPFFGPGAPQPKANDLFQSLHRFELPRQVNRHEMVFTIPPGGGDTMEAQCADFRQGRNWEFHGIALVDPHAETPLKLNVSLTPSNLPGAIHRPLQLEYVTRSVAPDDLICWENPGFHIEFPMQRQFIEALQAENFEWFDFRDEEG